METERRQGVSVWTAKGRNHRTSRRKGPGVCGTVCVLWGSDCFHTCWPAFSFPFCPDSCFSDSALKYVWGSSLGSWMMPFWYINLKICWNSSPIPHICRRLCLAHCDFAIQSGLPLTFVTFWFLCLCFCLRSWKTSCWHKEDTQELFAEFWDKFH